MISECVSVFSTLLSSRHSPLWLQWCFSFFPSLLSLKSLTLSDSGKSWVMLLYFRWKRRCLFLLVFCNLFIFGNVHWIYLVCWLTARAERAAVMQECTGANVKRSEVNSVHFWQCLPLCCYLYFHFLWRLKGASWVFLWEKSHWMACVKWLAKFSHAQTSRGSFGWNCCSWSTSCQILFSRFCFHTSMSLCAVGRWFISRRRLLDVFSLHVIIPYWFFFY